MTFVERDDARASEAEVVLQPDARAIDLPGPGRAAQLVGELKALSEASCAERVALRKQTARGVGHVAAAVGVVCVFDELCRAANRAKPKRFVADELVVSQAIVQLDDLHVFGAMPAIA